MTHSAPNKHMYKHSPPWPAADGKLRTAREASAAPAAESPGLQTMLSSERLTGPGTNIVRNVSIG